MKHTPYQRFLRRWKNGERGQALVEFSLVSIVFFLLLFGIFDTVLLLQSWVTVQHAAREAARYAITGQVTCPGHTGSGDHRDACIVAKAKEGTTGLVGGGEDASDSVVSVSTIYWDYPNYSGNGTAGAGEQCDTIEVTVHYRHHMATPLIKALIPGGVELTGKQRMTNEPFGTCSAPSS
jgi:Flp pilus assembly protein TadG